MSEWFRRRVVHSTGSPAIGIADDKVRVDFRNHDGDGIWIELEPNAARIFAARIVAMANVIDPETDGPKP